VKLVIRPLPDPEPEIEPEVGPSVEAALLRGPSKRRNRSAYGQAVIVRP